MLKLIVFDWDDCIIKGSTKAYYACYAAAIKEQGIEIDSATVERHVQELWGRPHRTVIESIIGAGNPHLDEVDKSYKKLLSTDLFTKHLSLIPGAKEAITSLKSQYKLAIATGMDSKVLKEKLIPKFGMTDLFSLIISSSELPDPSRGKPHPDMLFKLIKDFNVSASETISVGDAKGDAEMALAADVVPITVLTGQLTREEAEKLDIKYIIPSVAELPELISNF